MVVVVVVVVVLVVASPQGDSVPPSPQSSEIHLTLVLTGSAHAQQDILGVSMLTLMNVVNTR